jgi:isocitrate/isopropylmalate dehydrogenase
MGARSAYEVAYLRGGPEDESGPELADAAMAVLDLLLSDADAPAIHWVPIEAGVHCVAEYGTMLPEQSLARVLELGIAFKAPMASASTPGSKTASLTLRRELKAFANVNELRSYPGVDSALRPNIDAVLVRDNSEGLFAMHTVYPSEDTTVDLRFITRAGAQRIARVGFELAMSRRRRLTVCAFPVGINSDDLFIRACEEVAEEYPDVELRVRKPDAFAGTVIADPEQYDVVVAPNEWGSIMTDLLAAACGSVGLAGRANIGETTAYFEPIHGTAPGKAGKGTVNPISQIMAGKLLLEWLGRHYSDEAATAAARRLQDAVTGALAGGTRTGDIGGTATTAEMVASVCELL